MHRIFATTGSTLALLACAGQTQAQGFSYSPSFLSTSSGHRTAWFFGYRPSMRFQMVDGGLRGRVRSLKEVALRLEETVTPRGRTWSAVTLRIADGSHSTFGIDFSTNMTSTPTVVFSRSVNWPSVAVPALSRLDPWGGATGAYKMPFGTAWSYSGTTDVVTDWSFRGGKLANGYAWGKTNIFYYGFDSHGIKSDVGVSYGRGVPTTRLANNSPGVTGRCNDSWWGTHSHGSYLYGEGLLFGSAPPNPNHKNALVVRSRSWLTAPSAVTIHGWGFATNEIGFDVGTGCNRLHISGAMVLMSAVASSGGFAQTSDVVVPWQTNYAHGKLTVQGAWTDSKSGRIGLTQAAEIQLPGHMPQDGPVLRKCVYESDVTTTVGPFGSGIYNPALRYGH